MNFSSFLQESLLLEGGAAIKGSSRITQVEARHLLPDLIEKIAHTLSIPKEKIKRVGSAGKKPFDTDTSGDIDIAVECSVDDIKKALPRLAFDGETYKIMSSINVYSFGAKVLGKIVQVDLIPVHDANFADWSYVSDERDLAKGFKGAVRNELMFAVAKYADLKRTKENGEVVELDRHFFDLSKGLMRGIQTRKNAKGKIGKNFSTVEKDVITTDPNLVAKTLFGKKYTAEKLMTFDQVWKAIHDESFPWKDHLDDIIKMTKEGIKKKNLKMPDVLL